MSIEIISPPPSKALFWIGWVLSLLPAPLLIMSGVMKFMQPKEMLEGLEKMGWPPGVMTTLGVVELTSLALYLFPRTAIFGAILLTGYLGGAIATHVRVGDDFLIPLALGVILWVGLALRDARFRAYLLRQMTGSP
jgi:uncharacterized membrane protein YphA (DoxX/SURF4 family)